VSGGEEMNNGSRPPSTGGNDEYLRKIVTPHPLYFLDLTHTTQGETHE
tara:strand:- start:6286 stop:6429 length:144 start_codon:yes stop_codon:yes gene_type:complete